MIDSIIPFPVAPDFSPGIADSKNNPDFSPISSIKRRQVVVVREKRRDWTEVRRVLIEIVFISILPGLKPGATEEDVRAECPEG
ncbi:MAG TPA: hypothetical protein VN367_07080 [Chlorobaculum sp.]|nr:hypothetical protein [Chlorobaculum sp.]